MSNSHSDALVFFGATGDLAYKKIFPALQAMAQRGHLDVPVIGVAKAGWGLDQLKARARDSVEQHGDSIPRRSTSCAACCTMSMATTKTQRHFKPCEKSSAPRSDRRTTSRSRLRCSSLWSSNWPNPVAPS